MKYNSHLSLLSEQFTLAYPPAEYPELMHKPGRPYTCLLIDSHDNYFICIPFRSSIRHKNAFLFTSTLRSKIAKSGLDYSKIVIIKDTAYLDTSAKAVVDQDEYNEMMRNLSTIVPEACHYVDTYIEHVNGSSTIHPKAYARKYQYSTLPYFNNILL